MNLEAKRFQRHFGPIIDAIAKVDIDQEDRETIAKAVADELEGKPYFDRKRFMLLATDPLVPCAGALGEPCPNGIVIRIPMHNHNSPDGRSKVWTQRAPHGAIRCVGCGSREHLAKRTAA